MFISLCVQSDCSIICFYAFDLLDLMKCLIDKITRDSWFFCRFLILRFPYPSELLYDLNWIKKLWDGLFAVSPWPLFFVCVCVFLGVGIEPTFTFPSLCYCFFKWTWYCWRDYAFLILFALSLIKWRTSCKFMKWNCAQHTPSTSWATKQIESFISTLKRSLLHKTVCILS